MFPDWRGRDRQCLCRIGKFDRQGDGTEVRFYGHFTTVEHVESEETGADIRPSADGGERQARAQVHLFNQHRRGQYHH